MRKWALRIAVGVVALLLLLLAAGAALPREHVATSAVTLRQAPESVWTVVRDLGGIPRWWTDVATSEQVTDTGGREVWRQELDGFAMQLVVSASAAAESLVTTIDAPPGSAFGGTWTYRLAAADGGTRLTLTEAGWIANPLFRVMAHVGGLHRTVDSYLVALGARLGEAVTPEHLVR
jgi:uncharacterized protein YndB with AHSA1/START domain